MSELNASSGTIEDRHLQPEGSDRAGLSTNRPRIHTDGYGDSIERGQRTSAFS
ncbi:MAG: hypothetical protein JRF51_14995 [Deltaproteobacteria bacterium]|nr:hypothetical protein [Deltaproteobacteria bacterium]MBW2354513.1 hypothetical protein [Deltaproteobacteria bacterium]